MSERADTNQRLGSASVEIDDPMDLAIVDVWQFAAAFWSAPTCSAIVHLIRLQ